MPDTGEILVGRNKPLSIAFVNLKKASGRFFRSCHLVGDAHAQNQRVAGVTDPVHVQGNKKQGES